MTSSKFLIAAANSGAGKTTVTLGLMRAISMCGRSVQPFKCGPDYIDTKLHKLAGEKDSINLDLFLSSSDYLVRLFNKYSSLADVSVVEGAMGLFDGYDKMKGSAAEVAKFAKLPVILVVNAKASAYSVAALLYGFKHFDQELQVKGVIFNFVASESHYAFLKEACADVGIESLGYLPKDVNFEIPSRHLGLNTDETGQVKQVIDELGEKVSQYINITRLLELTQFSPTEFEEVKAVDTSLGTIAIAKDEAFNFVYLENLKALEERGSVTYFSPLRDKQLPEADFVYIPGGYPELYASLLSENKSMLQSIKSYVEHGGKLWAECGGMMYLSDLIETRDGTCYPMVGVFNQKSSMREMKLKLGYRTIEYQGVRLKGHEFHYSRIISDLNSVACQFNAKGKAVDTKLLRYKNAIGGYTHLYWAENIADWLRIFKN